MLKDLFLHLLIILLPIFLYQVFVLNFSGIHNVKNMKWTIGVLSGLSSALCMIFPINMHGFLWDLRFVPLYIAFVYGGGMSGIIASAILLICRMFLPLDPLLLLLVFAVHLLYCLPVFMIMKRYSNYSRLKKVIVSIGLASFSYLIVLSNLLYYLKITGKMELLYEHTLHFYVSIYVLEMITMMISVLLMETFLYTTKMQQEIVQSEKLGVVSQLAASVAHEVRNPLTVVRGFLQLLQAAPTNVKNAAYIETAIMELDRAELIISDYLNLAKPQLENIELINVAEEMQDVLALMTSYAAMAGVEIKLKCENHHLYVRGDKAKFKQFMINLIKNSIEATTSVESTVSLQVLKEWEHVIIKVTDSGQGMTREEIKRLGSPFYSTKSKGTGLGVMVIFQIIRAMGGTIEYASELGKGTQALIRLPLHKGSLQ